VRKANIRNEFDGPGGSRSVYTRVERPIEARGIGKGDFTFVAIVLICLQGYVMIEKLI
jgi:hypothetical protein